MYEDALQSNRELRGIVGRLEAAMSIVQAVGAVTELPRVLKLITARARSVIPARHVLILLLEGDDLVVHAAATEDGAAVSREGLAAQPGSPLPAAVEATGVVRIETEKELDELAKQLGVEGSSVLMAPLRLQGRSSGLVVAIDRSGSTPWFTEEDERLFAALASSTATAVATARTVERQRLRDSINAAEAERTRWARELHDDTLQSLGMLQVMLSTADRQPGGSEAAASKAADWIEEEITKLHALIAELRPASLDQIGLQAALESMIGQASAKTGIQFQSVIALGSADQASAPLDPDIESAIYRFTQEAVNNVAKHAQTSRATLRVRLVGEAVAVEVRDRGCGFDPSARSGGFGLTGMRERVELVGGRMRVRSGPGFGTSVFAMFPLKASDDYLWLEGSRK